LLYTSVVAPTYPLLVDTSFLTAGGTISNVVIEDTATPFWTSAVNVIVTDNNLEKTGTIGWNAGAVSTTSFTGDGFVEFTTSETNRRKIAGLSNGSAGEGYTEIDYAIYLQHDGVVRVYENGVNRGTFGTYAAGDVFRIDVTSDTVKYLRNGALFYTSAVAPTYPLLVDTSIYDVGGTITNVVIEPVTFWNEVQSVNTSGSSLEKSAGQGWNAGAVTTATIDSDGYVEFTTAETNTYKIAGLSNGNTDVDYTDIDFAIYPAGDGIIRIFENGVSRGSFGAYAAGDIFRVEVASGVVTYLHNGTLLYTSTVTPTSPLLVDTALHTTGATINDVTLVDL